ncbi:MAG: hypothetical protein GY724_30130 [Actinomycetia bacterium]|nr:hypothetical protein [Actinomycetes bacterium]MCP4085966.1 hypothetical protein [Actinomycetes bacterium]
MAEQIPMVDYLVLGDSPHLVANACDGCGAIYFDRRNGCAHCFGRSFSKKDLAATGTVRSFSIVHRAAKGVPAPFASAVVDLDGGGQVKGNVLQADGSDPTPENTTLGMKVQLTTWVAGVDDRGTEALAFAFEPAS